MALLGPSARVLSAGRARVLGLALLAVVLLGLATLVTLWVAATTEVGPILVELSATHGIHLGDVVVGVLAHGAAVALVALVAGALWAADEG